MIMTIYIALSGNISIVSGNDPIVLNNYGLDLVHQGELGRGLEQLQRAYNLYPYNNILKNNLAEAYTFIGKKLVEQRKYDDAADKFDLARELAPDNPIYGVLRGVAFYSGKRYEAALYEFNRARKLGGDTVEILFYSGKTYYDQGNLAAALECWESAIKISPANKTIQELAARARKEYDIEAKMDQGYSSRFTITYDTESRSNIAGAILDVLESAYNKISADLEYFPKSRTQVIIYTNKDYRMIADGPDWSGGMYDGKVRLPVGGAVEMTPMLRSVLYHEYTHAIVHDLAGNNCPFWLNEGLAEYEGRTQFNTPMASLGQAITNNAFLPFSVLERPTAAMSSKDAQLAYQQSYAMVNFVIASYGWPKIIQILINLGLGMTITESVNKALADLSIDYISMEKEWQIYMKREFAREH